MNFGEGGLEIIKIAGNQQKPPFARMFPSESKKKNPKICASFHLQNPELMSLKSYHLVKDLHLKYLREENSMILFTVGL